MSTSLESPPTPDIACRIGGEVLHGDKVGRILGFPTANMVFAGDDKPAYGIYAARVFLPDGRVLDAAANFGIRPTFSPPKELLETHILDFSEDLYGQCIDVELVRFLRPEKKFDDMGSLSDQLRQDCSLARETLATLAQAEAGQDA